MKEQLPSQLAVLRSDLDALGLTDGQAKGELRRGNLLRLGHGLYSPTAPWSGLSLDERYRQFIVSQWHRAKNPQAVVSHVSAGALWGLPMPRKLPQKLHLSAYAKDHGCQSPAVFRHRIAVPEADIVEMKGMRVTNLERTVIDIAMTESAELAIMCADAAARQYVLGQATHPRTGSEDDKAHTFSQLLGTQVRARSGCRGIRQARTMAELAAWQSESPGESLSRLRMHQLGMAKPELQVEVPGPGGITYRVDFLLRAKKVFCEFDGESKYDDDPTLARKQILAEKEREDWIRATTGWRGVRWRWKDVITLVPFETLARRTGLIY